MFLDIKDIWICNGCPANMSECRVNTECNNSERPFVCVLKHKILFGSVSAVCVCVSVSLSAALPKIPEACISRLLNYCDPFRFLRHLKDEQF